MRWLLVKDLQILRRSPLLLGLLVAYAVVIGLPVGYGLGAPPKAVSGAALFNKISQMFNSSYLSVYARRRAAQGRKRGSGGGVWGARPTGVLTARV